MVALPTPAEVAAGRPAGDTRTSDDIFASFTDDVLPKVEATAAPAFRADGCFATAKEVRDFALAGNATLTLVSKKTGTRFTYKLRKPEDGDGTFFFVSVLNGPDNWANYAYFGYVRRGVFLHGGAKAKVRADTPSVKAFAWAWEQIARDVLPATLEVWHEGKCGRCGRKLTVPESVASGFGPECAGKVGF